MKVTLFRGFPQSGVYVWSPFVTKLELRLRLAGFSYVTRCGAPQDGPTGKIPYVEVEGVEKCGGGGKGSECGEGEGKEGDIEKIGDSGLIVKFLVERGLMAELGCGGKGMKAQDLGVQALLEDRYYFLSMHERWIENYHTQRDHILSSLSFPVRFIVGLLIYRKTSQMLYGQGTGRYSADEIRTFREEIWRVLNAVLEESRDKRSDRGSEKPFWCLGGEHPTDCDTTLFGFINSALVAESCPVSKAFVKGLPAVMDYVTRIHNRYFPDYEGLE